MTTARKQLALPECIETRTGLFVWAVGNPLGFAAPGAAHDSITSDGSGAVFIDSNAPIPGPCNFTGRELDGVTRLQYTRARLNHSKRGRLTSQHPLGFDAGDANWYRYVGNVPTNATDPRGLEEKDNEKEKKEKEAAKLAEQYAKGGGGVQSFQALLEIRKDPEMKRMVVQQMQKRMEEARPKPVPEFLELFNAPDPLKAPPIPAKELQRLVKELGSEEFDVREEAQKELVRRAGEADWPALQKALQTTKDPEVKKRLGEVLKARDTLNQAKADVIGLIENLLTGGTPDDETRKAMKAALEAIIKDQPKMGTTPLQEQVQTLLERLNPK